MPSQNDDRPLTSDELAIKRTRMAAERTTMGYLRTSISLVGFGFSIPTFFTFLNDLPGFEDLSVTRPRIIGITLLLLAVVMLVTSIVQQLILLKRLSKDEGTGAPFSVSMLSSIVVLVIALSSLILILTRIGGT